MRIALIGPDGEPVSRVAGGTDTLLESLIDRLQKAGHEVVLSAPGAISADLYVVLVSDDNGNVTAATVSQHQDEASMLLQTG